MLRILVVVAGVPPLAGLDDRYHLGADEGALHREGRAAYDREDAVHEVRVAHGELQALAAPDEIPVTASRRLMPNASVSNRYCDLTRSRSL